jgi:hypothetical protein
MPATLLPVVFVRVAVVAATLIVPLLTSEPRLVAAQVVVTLGSQGLRLPVSRMPWAPEPITLTPKPVPIVTLP